MARHAGRWPTASAREANTNPLMLLWGMYIPRVGVNQRAPPDRARSPGAHGGTIVLPDFFQTFACGVQQVAQFGQPGRETVGLMGPKSLLHAGAELAYVRITV